MKRLLYIPLFLIFLFNCKSNEENIDPETVISPIVGKWLLTETEQVVNGKEVWQKSNTPTPVYINFRSDGVVVDGDGKASCCGPSELNINGKSFKIQPQSPVVYALNCAAVSCAPCPVLKIQQTGNEIIVDYCYGKMKYVRN